MEGRARQDVPSRPQGTPSSAQTKHLQEGSRHWIALSKPKASHRYRHPRQCQHQCQCQRQEAGRQGTPNNQNCPTSKTIQEEAGRGCDCDCKRSGVCPTKAGPDAARKTLLHPLQDKGDCEAFRQRNQENFLTGQEPGQGQGQTPQQDYQARLFQPDQEEATVGTAKGHHDQYEEAAAATSQGGEEMSCRSRAADR